MQPTFITDTMRTSIQIFYIAQTLEYSHSHHKENP